VVESSEGDEAPVHLAPVVLAFRADLLTGLCVEEDDAAVLQDLPVPDVAEGPTLPARADSAALSGLVVIHGVLDDRLVAALGAAPLQSVYVRLERVAGVEPCPLGRRRVAALLGLLRVGVDAAPAEFVRLTGKYAVAVGGPDRIERPDLGDDGLAGATLVGQFPVLLPEVLLDLPCRVP
jgi:hypothetical protein